MIGARIKAYLTENGIKQSYVVEKTGIPHPKLSEIFNKGRRIDCVDYYKICKALNLPLEHFFTDDERKEE